MLKALLKDSMFYGFFLILGKMINLIMLPLITDVFSPNDYLMIDSTLVFLNFIVPFIFLGLDSAVARYYNDYLQSNEINKFVSTTFFSGLLSALLVTILCIIFNRQIQSYYLNNMNSTIFLLISFITIPFIYINSFCTNIFKYAFRRVAFLIVALGNPLIQTISIFILIEFHKLDLYSFFLLNLVTNFTFAIIACSLLKNHLSPKINKEVFIEVYKFGLPFTGVSFLGVAFSFTERVFLNNYYSAVIAGQYAFAYRIVGFINMINKTFQLSWGPFAMTRYKDEKSPAVFNKLLLLMTGIMCVISILITLFDEKIIDIIANSSYVGAKFFLPFLLISNTLLILSSITNVGINIIKKTNLHLINYGGSLLTLIGLFLFFQNVSKDYSLPIAVLVSHLVLFIAQSFSSNRVYDKINFMWIRSLLLVILSGVMMLYLVFY